MTHEEALELAAAFVLGALEPEEEQAVREHLATCDLPHPEFAELGSVVPLLAESVRQVDPPARLRDRIMAAAARDLEAQAAGRAEVGRRAEPALPGVEREAARPRRPFTFARPAWALAAAAVIVIAALGVWNIRLQSDLSSAQAYRDRVDQVLSIARQPDSAVAILSGDQGQNTGLVAVARDGTAAMVLRGLPPTTGSQVYQAWVIVGSNAPVPVGALAYSDGVGYLATNVGQVGAGATVAFTREPGPGATKPTPPIVSSGVLSSAPS
jgi:anti-sigma factor RsiW